MSIRNIRSFVFTALFAALFIVLSIQQMKLTISAIPITAQTFGIILAGLFLKPRYAFASIAAVIVLAAFGLPLFGGKGGISALLGPTGGFIFAFPFAAMLVSWSTDKLLARPNLTENKWMLFVSFFAIFELFSSLLTYAGGVPWLKYNLDLSWAKAFAGGMLPFLPGDAVKSAIGAVIAVAMLPSVIRYRSSDQLDHGESTREIGI